MIAKQRVVVTGLGTVNPLGSSVRTFWDNCVRGSSGVYRITDFAIPETMSQIAGQVLAFEPQPIAKMLDLPLEQVIQYDRSLLFALHATLEALANAGLTPRQLQDSGSTRTAIQISSAIAHIGRMEQAFRQQSDEGQHPLALGTPKHSQPNSFFFNTPNGEVARLLGLPPRYVTIATGCTGGVDAVGFAMQAIRSGQADLVISGATEAPITPLVVAAFSKIGATSLRNHDPAHASRPFDVDRDGFVLAEGCGVLILESLAHARQRGARIYAEIIGFGSVNNCHHMTAINPNGVSIARACQEAIRDAGIGPEAIDFVNLHGSSTPQNDIAEANALQLLLGKRGQQIPVTSLKSQTGHGLSAANSIELLSVVLSLHDGVIPPTINLKQQDPLCPLRVVAHEPHYLDATYALKTSSGFSGIHSSLIVKRWDATAR